MSYISASSSTKKANPSLKEVCAIAGGIKADIEIGIEADIRPTQKIWPSMPLTLMIFKC